MTESRWYKGCMHAHTTESDGDASPAKVAEWFRDHGYDWVIMSDHNTVTQLENRGGMEDLLTISGEEITAHLEGDPLAVYVNAFRLSNTVDPIVADGVLSTLQANINTIITSGGIASFGAPYYRDGFDHKTLLDVTGPGLMEIFNGHPANIKGDPRTFSYEAIWDMFLDTGRIIYGTATDDCHNYFHFSADNSNPGQAWVMVKAEDLSESAILNALTNGSFYASTGVSLSGLETSKESVSLKIDTQFPNSLQSYTTTFVGKGSTILAQEIGLEASYQIRGDESYVRARVDSSWGARAWTQPVFLS